MTETTAVAVRPESHSPLAALVSDPGALKELPIETVERLMALHREHEADAARKAFAAAFVAAQSEMQPIVKDRKNTGHKGKPSRYADAGRMMQQVQPVIAKHGFSQSLSMVDGAPDGEQRYRLLVRHVDGHEEAHFFDTPDDHLGQLGNPSKTRIAGRISASTYLIRHLTAKVWNLVMIDADDDGNAAAMGPGSQPVTEEQRIELSDLVTDSGADIARFCKWLGVRSLKELPAGRFLEARAALMAKKARGETE